MLAGLLDPERLDDAVVLALPRGGVPVAVELARHLGAPLDLLFVRKLGAPGQPELAVGAVADGIEPVVVYNEDILEALGLDAAGMQEGVAAALREIETRRARYLHGRPPLPLAGRSAILVDDGIATGATTRAALRAARQQRPRRLLLATPVAPPGTLVALRGECDQIICAYQPPDLGAISAYYDDFHQVADAEVIEALAASGQPMAP